MDVVASYILHDRSYIVLATAWAGQGSQPVCAERAHLSVMQSTSVERSASTQGKLKPGDSAAVDPVRQLRERGLARGQFQRTVGFSRPPAKDCGNEARCPGGYGVMPDLVFSLFLLSDLKDGLLKH